MTATTHTLDALPPGFEYRQEEGKIYSPATTRYGDRHFGVIKSDGRISHNDRLAPSHLNDFIELQFMLLETSAIDRKYSPKYCSVDMPPLPSRYIVTCCSLSFTAVDCYSIGCILVAILCASATIAILVNQPCLPF